MKVTLLFPPCTDPRSPHLALPYLAAVVRKAGLEAELLDLDVGGMLALLEPAHLARAGQRVARKAAGAGSESAIFKGLAALSELLPARVDDALATLRDGKRFYDANQFNAAR